MNWDRVSGNWKQMKGKIKEQWGKLTDDEIEQIAGSREQLEGKIQERYGIAKAKLKARCAPNDVPVVRVVAVQHPPSEPQVVRAYYVKRT